MQFLLFLVLFGLFETSIATATPTPTLTPTLTVNATNATNSTGNSTRNSTNAAVTTAASLDELKLLLLKFGGIKFGAWNPKSIDASKITVTIVLSFGSYAFALYNSDDGPLGTVSTIQGKLKFKGLGSGCKKAAMALMGADDLETVTGYKIKFPKGLKAITHMVIARFDALLALIVALTSLIEVEVTLTSTLTVSYAYRTPDGDSEGDNVKKYGGSLGACGTPSTTCYDIMSPTSTVSTVSGSTTSGAMRVSAPTGLFLGLLAALYVMMA